MWSKASSVGWCLSCYWHHELILHQGSKLVATDVSFKVEDILRAIVTDGNDADSDLSLICAEGNIGNDV